MFNENEKTNCRNDSTVQCSDAAADEWRKEKKKNEKMINVGEKLTKNVEIKRVVKKKFSKKKENFDIMMFEVVDVKNPNAVTFMKYYINDTTTISSSFTKEKNSKKNENESSEKAKKKKTDE